MHEERTEEPRYKATLNRVSTELKFWLAVFWLWVMNILLALNQLAAAILGFDPDEALSSVIGKNSHRAFFNFLAGILNWLDPDHTIKYKELDEGKHSVWKKIYGRYWPVDKTETK